MNLKDKTFLITGILTDKSIAFSAAKIALEKGATIIATGFGDGLRITQRAVKRLDGEIEVLEMDIQNTEQVQDCLLYTSPSPRDLSTSRMPSSA